MTYAIGRRISLFNRLHDAALFVGHLAHPVRLAGADDQMGAPGLDLAVHDVGGLDLEAPRVPDGAALAVVEALVAVDGRVRLGEELRGRRRTGPGGTTGAAAKDGRYKRLE